MHILYLHGLAGGPEDWCATQARLPGVGALTPRLDYLHMGAGGLEFLAERLLSSLPPWFDPARSMVVGNSLGGALALLLGGRFARVVLAAPHVQTLHGRLERGAGTVHRELARVFHDPQQLHAAQVQQYERLWRRVSGTRQRVGRLRLLKRSAVGFDFEKHLARCASRVLLVCGRSDALSPLSRFRQIVWKHPDVRLQVLEHCGHAVPLERPEALARLISNELWALEKKCAGPEKNACQWGSKRLKAFLRNTPQAKKQLTVHA